MSDDKKYPIGNTNNYKEGTTIRTNSEGTTHQSNWYANNATSWRTSTDYDKDGNASNKHTKKNK